MPIKQATWLSVIEKEIQSNRYSKSIGEKLRKDAERLRRFDTMRGIKSRNARTELNKKLEIMRVIAILGQANTYQVCVATAMGFKTCKIILNELKDGGYVELSVQKARSKVAHKWKISDKPRK